jgi:hypothetical protein
MHMEGDLPRGIAGRPRERQKASPRPDVPLASLLFEGQRHVQGAGRVGAIRSIEIPTLQDQAIRLIAQADGERVEHAALPGVVFANDRRGWIEIDAGLAEPPEIRDLDSTKQHARYLPTAPSASSITPRTSAIL